MSRAKLRPIQIKVLDKIREAIKAGKTDIFIQAPTGTGKGWIALEIAKESNAYILTSEKSLQAQYEEDTIRFDDYYDVKSICGIDTYRCNVNDEKFSLGVCRSLGMSNAEALKLPCAANCEYLQRWVKAKAADQTVMNYSYYLVQMNYVLNELEGMAPFQARELVVCDEAHKLPDIIEGHFACTIDTKIIDQITRCLMMVSGAKLSDRRIDCQPLYDQILRIIKMDIKADAKKHLDQLENLENEYAGVLSIFNDLKADLAAKFLSKKGSVEDLKKKAKKLPKEARFVLSMADNLKDRHCKIQDYVENIKSHGIRNLIVDADAPQSRTYHNLSDADLFRKHFEKFSKVRVYLSATVQPELLIKRWGINPDDAYVMYVKSEWDEDKSRVVLTNTANMSYNNTENAMRDAVRKINLILDKHQNERGVIHTTSNAVTEEVCANVHPRYRNRLIRYASTKEKMEIMSAWDKYPTDAVLVGPSLTTGLDFRDDHARFNIVVKLSYPNMRSALWAKRADALPHIYLGETAAVLEQACGRTTRSKDDWSVTYILDSRAEKFMLQHQKYFSPSFLERVRLE